MDFDAGIIPTAAPVFPLPDVVLFPRVVLPLHVFEPRYRAMTADALTGSRAIVVALLRSGYESEYGTNREPIFPIAGLGQVIHAARLDDGRYHITLAGRTRVRLVKEQRGKPYRVYRIEPLESTGQPDELPEAKLRGELREAITAIRGIGPLRQAWLELFSLPLDLDALVDLVSSALPRVAEVRQSLLAELDVVRRCALLRAELDVLQRIGVHQTRLHEQCMN